MFIKTTLHACALSCLVFGVNLSHAAPSPITYRQILDQAIPTVSEALRRIEIQRGKMIADVDIQSTTKSEDFIKIHNVVQDEFCAQEINKNVVLCIERKNGNLYKTAN
jgi:hypothetical protein